MNPVADAAGRDAELLVLGTRIGSYTIASHLGEGLSASVYSARDDTGRRVALKVIHRARLNDPQIFERFRREAAVLKRLDGAHLVRFVDFIDEPSVLAMALEFIDGESLARWAARRQPLATGRALDVAVQLCRALECAHAVGVIHRDLKPENVIASDLSDGGVHISVLDFGLAKLVRGESSPSDLSHRDVILGTAEYMAPEQITGECAIDERCDVYAVGAILYELLVGKPPVVGPTPLETMAARLNTVPTAPRLAAPDRSIPAAVNALVLRAIATNRDERFGSARELHDALSALLLERRIIGSGSPSDASALGASDTDLHLNDAALGYRETWPDPVVTPAIRTPESDDAALQKLPSRWTFALLGIVLGALALATGVALAFC
jgi:serine/threonine-protein kinase